MNIIREIESNSEISAKLKALEYQEEQLWPILRIAYFFSYRKTPNFKKLNAEDLIILLIYSLNNLSNFFYFFKKCEFLSFSNTLETKKIEDNYSNKTLHSLFNILGDRLQYVEQPKLKLKSSLHRRYDISLIWLQALNSIVLKFYKPMGKIQFFDELNKKYQISVDYRKSIASYLLYKKMLRWILKIKSPKYIFLTEYYSFLKMALISVAKELNITVIEFQHGVINQEHPAYNFYTNDLERKVIPDYLFCYGEHEKKELSHYGIFKYQNIFPIGQFYIDYKLSKPPTAKLSKKFSALITLQTVNETAVIDFLEKAAIVLPDVDFYLLPRLASSPHKYEKAKNMKMVVGDFYELIKKVDIHVTAFSTCATEALIFDKPNILINIENMAINYFGEIFKNSDHSQFVNTPNEFVQAINYFMSQKVVISEETKNYLYSVDHNKKIKNALFQIGVLN